MATASTHSWQALACLAMPSNTRRQVLAVELGSVLKRENGAGGARADGPSKGDEVLHGSRLRGTESDASRVAQLAPAPCISPMPTGKSYTLEGQLLHGADCGTLALRMDDGGSCRLDAPSRMRPLIGRRVRVSGIRSGFDLIDISRFALA